MRTMRHIVRYCLRSGTALEIFQAEKASILRDPYGRLPVNMKHCW